MLDKVVAEFVDGFRREEDFYAPFNALLHAEGFQAIHYLHGPHEQGRDFIAQGQRGRSRSQFSFQLKKGDIGQADWRSFQGQCEQVFYSQEAVHIGLNEELPNVMVLVLTGHLKGGAQGATQQYRKFVERRKIGTFLLWDRNELIALFSKHLAVSSNARWEVLGNLIEQSRGGFLSLARLEAFSQRWLGMDTSQANLEYYLAREFLVRDGLTLHAFQLFLGWIRKLFYEGACRESFSLEMEELVRAEMRWYARPILDWFESVSPEMRTHALVDYTLMEIANCGSRLLLMMEMVALDLLMNPESRQGPQARRFFEHCLSLGTVQKPLSDQYAGSVLAIALASLRLGVETRGWLTNMVKWIGDCYEQGWGLAAVEEEPLEEMMRVLAPSTLKGTLKKRTSSLLASAVLECLQLNEFDDLLRDSALDFWDLKIAAGHLHPDKWPQEMLRDGRGTVLRLDNLQALGEGLKPSLPAGEHERPFDREGRSWVAVALMLLLRDRWWSYSHRRLAAEPRPTISGPSAGGHTGRPKAGSKKPAAARGGRAKKPRSGAGPAEGS